MPPAAKNQNPEQIARDQIDARLAEAGWRVQDKDALDFNAGQGIAVREYPTDIGPADYVMFVDRCAVGVIEAKPEDWGHKITTAEEQAEGYAGAALKWVKNNERLRARHPGPLQKTLEFVLRNSRFDTDARRHVEHQIAVKLPPSIAPGGTPVAEVLVTLR
jgi:type I site-specific restriction endonuclease